MQGGNVVVVNVGTERETKEQRLTNKEMRKALYYYRMKSREKTANLKVAKEIDERKDQIAYTMRRSPYV